MSAFFGILAEALPSSWRSLFVSSVFTSLSFLKFNILKGLFILSSSESSRNGLSLKNNSVCSSNNFSSFIVNAAKSYNKNLVLTHYSKDKYITVQKGDKSESIPSGEA